MCLGGTPSVSQAPAQVQQVSAPPAPPRRDPQAPVIDPNQQNAREAAAARRKGTSIFRSDLTIPSAATGTGVGINVPG
jgi:hypothetical protein